MIDKDQNQDELWSEHNIWTRFRSSDLYLVTWSTSTPATIDYFWTLDLMLIEKKM